jgi:hypothetical protein
VYVCVYVHVYVYVHVCVCVYVYVHVCVCVHVYVHVLYACEWPCVRACVRGRVHVATLRFARRTCACSLIVVLASRKYSW